MAIFGGFQVKTTGIGTMYQCNHLSSSLATSAIDLTFETELRTKEHMDFSAEDRNHSLPAQGQGETTDMGLVQKKMEP